MNCETRPGPGDACGQCGSCRKILDDVHPDVHHFRVFNEEGKVKGQTERVRELIGALGFPPHEGRARLVLVDPAHELNEDASNVLLKTLEEPPADTHFVLVTTTASRLLVTIRSRCQRLAFAPLPEADVERVLVEQHEVDADAARSAARLSGGSLGKALELVSGGELPARRQRALRLLEAAHGGKAQAALDVAGELAGDRDEAAAMLSLLWVAYHDALLLQRGHGDGAGTDEVRRLAGRVGTRGLLVGLHAVEEADDALRGWVSPQLALERLVLQLGRARAA
jgi:DNA polymerase-3 subunit delta'